MIMVKKKSIHLCDIMLNKTNTKINNTAPLHLRDLTDISPYMTRVMRNNTTSTYLEREQNSAPYLHLSPLQPLQLPLPLVHTPSGGLLGNKPMRRGMRERLAAGVQPATQHDALPAELSSFTAPTAPSADPDTASAAAAQVQQGLCLVNLKITCLVHKVLLTRSGNTVLERLSMQFLS